MSAAVGAPDWWDRQGEALAERLNPIIVKEVRQGLRTKVFWIFFSLMLFACLVISLVAAAAADGFSTDGKYFFFAYFFCLGIVQFFVIPYSAYRSMAREREDETWVLLTLTGLGPKRILRGKMGSFMLQGLLYASACMPFLLFSYFLNGIDLPTIFTAMMMAAAYQLFLTSVAVSAATLAESRIVRALLHFLLLGFLLWGLVSGLTSSFGLTATRGIFGGGAPTWLAFVGGWWAIATWGVLLYESAAARLSLPTESYAIGYRLTFVVQVLGTLVFCAVGALLAHDAEVLTVGALVLFAHSLFVGIFIASDRDGMAKALRTTKTPWLLKPGGLRGYWLVLLTTCLLAGACIGLQVVLGGKAHEADVIAAAPAFLVIYLALPILLARGIAHQGFQTAGLTRVLFFVVLVFACGAPPLVSALFGREPDAVTLNLLNPIVGLMNLGKGDGGALFGIGVPWVVALVLGAWAHGVLTKRDAEITTARGDFRS